MRKAFYGPLTALLLLLSGQTKEAGAQVSTLPLTRDSSGSFRVLSWNVSGVSLVENAEQFRSVFRTTDPDILILDEAHGSRDLGQIMSALRGIRSRGDTLWHVTLGAGGGYQRGLIATRFPMREVPALSRVVPYPDSAVVALRSMLPDTLWPRALRNMHSGIAVAGGIIQLGTESILAVSVDLQCCNSTPDWPELRRRVEAGAIRAVIQSVLAKDRVGAVLVAGDLNLVSTGTPLGMLTNPYPAPHFALVPADAWHLDGLEAWTWDGRGSPFPSRALDFQLYSPASLQVARAFVFSTENIESEELAALGLTAASSRHLSAHLPIIVDYVWRKEP